MTQNKSTTVRGGCDNETHHVLAALHGTFQNPSDTVGICPGIKWIKWDDVCSFAVEHFPVNFEMPLVAGSDTALLNVLCRIRGLHKLDSTKASGCCESENVSLGVR